MTTQVDSIEPRQAPAIELTDSSGNKVQLQQLWEKSPLLLQFSRHLGCAFCREQAKLLKEDHQTIMQHGAQVALVTMGNVEQAAKFNTAFDLPFPVLADPEQQAYQSFEVPRGSLNQVGGPQVWLKGLSAVVRCGMSRPHGDLMQLQATYLINQQGKICWQFLPKNSADHASTAEIVEAIEQLKAS